MKLEYGHWIVQDKNGDLLATAYSAELEVGAFDMVKNADVRLVVKAGSGERFFTTIKRLKAALTAFEESGDYVREVFVAPKD